MSNRLDILKIRESKILSSHETGFGLLIEADAGYIDKAMNKDLFDRILNENFEIKPNQPILINCILQKWGIKNKNGRIYPQDVLVPEVERYMEQVNMNSAISEADHPECVRTDSLSMIYSKNGWIKIEDISNDEEIYTLNTITNKIEIQKIQRNIQKKYEGIMYEFKSKNSIDLTITPNHRVLLEDSKSNRFYLTAKEIYEDIGGVYSSGKYKILKRGNWDGIYSEFFTLNGLPRNFFSKNHTHLFEKYKNDINIKSEDWYAFLGIYLAEGYSNGTILKRKYNKGYKIFITQKKEEIKNKIEELLKSMPFKWTKVVRNTGVIDYCITDPRLYEYLYPLGSSDEKYIPTEIKQASPDLLKILFKWFQLGDGRNVKTLKSNKQSVFSTSKKLIYDLHDILIKTGGYGTISEYQPKDRYIEEITTIKKEIDNGDGTASIVEEKIKTKRLIKQSNSKIQYNLNISNTKYIWLDKRNVKITPIEYNGMVSCVTVQNNNFFVMRNGKAHWTGNSSVVSLLNVSHRITKMWWGNGEDKNVLYGTLEIITSPSYIRDGIGWMIGDKIVEYLKRGIRLGISSRGVGTLKEIRGENIVQNDFELICFDLVASPSTPGAYLFPEISKSFTEGISNTSDQINENEKHKKIITSINKFLL